MQKYGIILARQCALSDSCLLVLGIKKCTAMRRAFHPIARMLLSVTSLRNVLTLSMCVRGNADDKKIVEHFFDLMEESIGLLIGEV